MAIRLLTVSNKVSPLLTEEDELLKLTMSADNLFSASSKDRRVRVEFSKKALAMVISRREGTRFIGRLITSLNSEDVLKINRISSTVRSLIPARCSTLNPDDIIITNYEFQITNFLSGSSPVFIFDLKHQI